MKRNALAGLALAIATILSIFNFGPAPIATAADDGRPPAVIRLINDETFSITGYAPVAGWVEVTDDRNLARPLFRSQLLNIGTKFATVVVCPDPADTTIRVTLVLADSSNVLPDRWELASYSPA